MGKRRCHDLGDGVIACGGKPTAKDLAEIERFKRFLRREMTMAEAREYAGLTIAQAAKLSGIPSEAIEASEAGTVQLDELADRKLRKLYGYEPKTTEPSSG